MQWLSQSHHLIRHWINQKVLAWTLAFNGRAYFRQQCPCIYHQAAILTSELILELFCPCLSAGFEVFNYFWKSKKYILAFSIRTEVIFLQGLTSWYDQVWKDLIWQGSYLHAPSNKSECLRSELSFSKSQPLLYFE